LEVGQSMGVNKSRPPVTFSPPVSLLELAGGREFRSYKFIFSYGLCGVVYMCRNKKFNDSNSHDDR
jgi:hypothetical protein